MVSRVFATRFDNEPELVASHYLDPSGLRDLLAMGQVIGLHGHEHLHLASASPDECRTDLAANFNSLREALQADVPRFDWISYPYGGPASYSDMVIGIARSLGCCAGLTMRRGINRCDGSLDSMRLARVDTKDAPGGRSPLPLEQLLES